MQRLRLGTSTMARFYVAALLALAVLGFGAAALTLSHTPAHADCGSSC